MEDRPYRHLKGQELTALFEANRTDLPVLEKLRAELLHRTTPSMRGLRVRVDLALAAIKKTAGHQPTTPPSASRSYQPVLPMMPDDTAGPDTTPASSKPPTGRPENSAGDRDDVSGDTICGKVGSIRPCGAVPGVPSRWTHPEKREFEIEIGKNATRIERFIAALRALVKDMRQRGNGMRTVTLEHGEAVLLDGRERGYRFPYDGDADLFEGAKVTIAIGN